MLLLFLLLPYLLISGRLNPQQLEDRRQKLDEYMQHPWHTMSANTQEKVETFLTRGNDCFTDTTEIEEEEEEGKDSESGFTGSLRRVSQMLLSGSLSPVNVSANNGDNNGQDKDNSSGAESAPDNDEDEDDEDDEEDEEDEEEEEEDVDDAGSNGTSKTQECGPDQDHHYHGQHTVEADHDDSQPEPELFRRVSDFMFGQFAGADNTANGRVLSAVLHSVGTSVTIVATMAHYHLLLLLLLFLSVESYVVCFRSQVQMDKAIILRKVKMPTVTIPRCRQRTLHIGSNHWQQATSKVRL